MQVRILGPLEVREDDRVVELGAGRQRALLALLAIHAPETVSTDRLIEELWGSVPPPTAVKALQNLVSALRRTLGAGAIATRPPGYALTLADDDLDSRTFERIAAEGRRVLEDDPRRAAEKLNRALGLWRGPALAEFAYEGFAQNEIARLEELRLGVLEDRIDADLATGAAAELVPELESLVTANPLRERLRGQLMVALYRSGRQADALETFRAGRAVLHEELGLEPGTALRELETAILNQDPALGARAKQPRPPPTTRRRRALAGLVATVAIALVAVAVVTAVRDDPAPTVVPDSLVKIDAASNEIVDVVPVGALPGKVAVVGDHVLVSSEQDATLTRIHTGTGETTTSGISGADMGLAALGDRYAWVISLRQDRVTRVDVERLESIEGLPLPPDLAYAFVAVGGGSLWVTEVAPPAVVRYGLRTLQLERRYDLAAFEFPVDPTYGYGAAWVVMAGTRTGLLRIDARTGATKMIPTAPRPSPPVAGFGYIWTGSFDEGTLWRIDGIVHEAREVLDAGRSPFGIATGAGSVWVGNNCGGTISRIDPDTLRVVATIETGFFPKAMAFGNGHVWVALTAEPWDPEICE